MAKATETTTNNTAQPVSIPRPRVEVLERGLQNPFGFTSTDIKLKDPDLVCHWCNTEIHGSQLHKYTSWGYLKTRPEYLANPDEVGGFTVSAEGYVTRGPRHAEILLYTTRENKQARERAKIAANRALMDPHRTHRDMLEAAGSKLGSEAADFLEKRTRVVGGVKDSYERIEQLPEGNLD